MPQRSEKRARPQGRYRPTSIPGLFLHPTVFLLNLVVITFEDDAKTDGLIPPETVDKVTALIRQTYDFPDLDRDQGKGVAISFIGQFFNPDDYLEHRIAQTHSEAILHALEGDLQPRMVEAPELRTSKMAEFTRMAPEGKRALPLYYKQRFLSFCFAGPETELDRLRDEAPDELLGYVMGTLWQDLGISDQTFVMPHPAFVPVSRLRRVSQQNAVHWAEQMVQLIEQGKVSRT
ncbi:MAG: hypothetical protein FJ026_00495 [Chloroflexi bacterium]|nr:hypothetical protein [Chloroflexota bacterium]